MKPNEKKGIKFRPILDIDPSLFVIPPLHVKLGLVNRAFIKTEGYSYFSWSQKCVENIPEEEKIAWDLYRNQQLRVEDKNEDIVIFQCKMMTI